MGEKENVINQLIQDAIDASIKFEALMDAIDFNSYLSDEEETDSVRQTNKYQIYEDRVKSALKSCQDVVKKTPEEIKEITHPETLRQKKLSQYLIYHLFEAKKIRLKAREQTKWDEEEKRYVDSTHELHKAFNCIPKEKFYGTQKGKSLTDNYNWAKVLFYNEMAICYSGLAESSISLGYAERARFLVKEIYPKINHLEEENQDIKLYTFALYNKGEAERLLHNDDLSLRTFYEIIEIYKRETYKGKKSSDYYSALLRMALMLIDQGRGKEALNLLEKVKNLEHNDYRKEECDMEKASALIDQREYKKALPILEEYIKNNWNDTFTHRKATLHRIWLLLEWRKNRFNEFKKIPDLVEEYNNIPKTIEKILTQCVERKDGDNFKKACKYFSEYHDGSNVRKKDEELKGYFCYLKHETFLKGDEGLKKFLESDWEALGKEIQKKQEEYCNTLDKVEDEDYLNNFFGSYKEYLQEDLKRQRNESLLKKLREHSESKRDFLKIINKLHERLSGLYREKDKLQKMEEIERDYNIFEELLKPQQETDQDPEGEVAKFITTRFFKTKHPDNKRDRIYLSSNTIENRMHRNTDEFADKILGSSKHIFPSEGNRINGILTVLRRWNSFTPSLSSLTSPSRGGGYFLYFKDGNGKSKGIVIDPGYDFLDNLFFEGFTISDIDVVLISHAHPDHTDNFPKMLTLFHEMNGRLKQWKEKTKEYDRKHIKVILSQGVFDLFNRQMDYSKESLKDIYVVDTKAIEENDKPIECYKAQIGSGNELRIKAVRTSHGDLSQWESIGFLFNIESNEKNIQIGYTSDAKWSNKFVNNFSDCSIICAHLGSIVNILDDKNFCNTFCKKFQKNDNDNKCKKLNTCKKSGFKDAEISETNLIEQTRDENHLYLTGLSLFFDSLFRNSSNLKIGIVSEFGEELKGGIRMDLYHKFDDWFKERKGKSKTIPKCLPGDIGLRVDIFSGDVFCQTCQRYVDRKEINPIAYGKEEAICFVCNECQSVLSTYQIEEKLKDYCENGHTSR